MKNPIPSIIWVALITGGVVLPAAAQNNSSATIGDSSQATVSGTSTQSGAASAQEAPVTLSYGVADVVKLTQAQVSENVILTYVQNSGTAYSLGPKEVVYLKEQGVTDTVLAAMLAKRSASADIAYPTQTQPAFAPQVAWQDPNIPAPDYSYAAPVPVFNPNPAPVADPVSTLYIIPYPTGQRTYSGSPYIYYGGGYSYSSYCYPRYGASYGYRYSGYSHGHGHWHH